MYKMSSPNTEINKIVKKSKQTHTSVAASGRQTAKNAVKA